MSTDTMDTEEVDTITKIILDKTKIKTRQVQRRSRLLKDGTWNQTMPQDHCLYLYLRVKMKIGW